MLCAAERCWSFRIQSVTSHLKAFPSSVNGTVPVTCSPVLTNIISWADGGLPCTKSAKSPSEILCAAERPCSFHYQSVTSHLFAFSFSHHDSLVLTNIIKRVDRSLTPTRSAQSSAAAVIVSIIFFATSQNTANQKQKTDSNRCSLNDM